MSVASYYLSKLEKSPEHQQYLTNSWADYIELVCLASIDDEVSEEDMIDRLSGRVKDLREAAEEDLAEMDEMEKEPDEGIQPSRRAEVSDKWKTRVRDYFKVLSLRHNLYGDNYPFELSGDSLRRKEDFNEEHFLYVYLLLCSNLYLLDNVTSGEFSSCFELVSFNAFSTLLPSNATIHLFGKNSYNKRGRFSSGTFWNKLNRLRRDINEERNAHLRKSDFSDHHTGDEGLDLVGWLPTGDSLSSSLIYFAQCACTYDFVEKQHSSSPVAWSQKLTFKNPPSNSTFIPHCFRRADGTWIKSTWIMDTFLVDRKRILNFYSDSEKIKFASLPIFSLVKEIIGSKELVV